MLLGLYPFTRSQFFDNNGSPLTGGFIYAYASGTDTPATLYQDGYGLIPHAWPIVLDDSGSEKIYMAPLAYKIVIKDQFGVLIEERDPVYSNGFIGGGDSTGSFVVVDNYNALRNLTQQVDTVFVLGRDTPNDGGSGIFVYDVNATGIDDDGIVLVRSTTDRYVRQMNGYIEAAWFGALYNQAVDNSNALTNASNASITYNLPVMISKSLYFNSNYTLNSGVRLILNGAITSPAGISFRFKEGSKLISANTNSFAPNIQPIFESGVSDELKVSWFGGSFAQIIASTTFNYNLLVDKNVNITSDLDIPSNFAVDFVGGSKLVVKSLSDIKIRNLVYAGTGSIVIYNDKSYIKSVIMGNGYCYLEWFGGVAGSAIDTDNSIPFKAAVAHGKIYLISDATKFYNIPAGTYTNSNGLVMLGNYVPNNDTTNSLVPSTIRLSEGANLTVGPMTLTALKVIGSGTIVSGETTINEAIISSTVGYSTTLSKVNDSLSIDPQYLVVGASGKVIKTTDINGTWNTQTSGTALNISSIARSNKLFVFVAKTGIIKTSPDGVTWTTRTSGITANLNCVKWFSSIGKFIAVGESGYVLSSTDGISWNSIQTALTSIKSVTYFNGKYVIVGGSGKIYTSPDLTTWTQKVVTGLSGTLYSVDSSNTLLTIVGYNGTVVTSTDAVNFTIRLTSVSQNLQSIKYYASKSIWLIGGANGTVMQSTDGINFSTVNTYLTISDSINDQCLVNGQFIFALSSGYILSTFNLTQFTLTQPVDSISNTGIIATPSEIVAIGDSGSITYTTDGVTYTSITPVTANNLNRIKKIGSVYYVVGNGGTYLTSFDAITWTAKTVGNSANLMDIEADSTGTLFIVTGSAGYIATSPDANATSPIWTVQTSPVGTKLNQIFRNDANATRKYQIIGDSGVILYSTNGTTWTKNSFASRGLLSNGTLQVIFGDAGLVLTSTDGITWTKRVSNTSYDLLGGVYSGSQYVIVGANGVAITSPDGITWTVRSTGVSTILNSVEYASSLFVAVGEAGVTLRSSDAITWTPTNIGAAITLYKVRYLNNTWIVTGVNGATGIILTSSNATAWTSQTSGSTKAIYDIAWTGSQYIHVGAQGSVFYGAMGTFIASSTEGTTDDLYSIYFNGTIACIVGDNGKALMSSNGVKFVNITSGTTRLLKSITKVGSTYYAIGPSMTVLKSSEMIVWDKSIYNPVSENLSGVFDGTNYVTVAGDYNTYSKDGIVWIYIDNKVTGMSNVTKIGTKYTIFGFSNDSSIYESTDLVTWTKNIVSQVGTTITSITKALLNGNNVVIYFTSNGLALSGSVTNATLTATKISLEKVLSGIKIINTLAGNISDSKLYDISTIGRVVDTTISDFNGSIEGSVNRSDISFRSPIGIKSIINVSDSSFTNKSGKKIDVFSIDSAVSAMTISNCKINSSGSMIAYSENTSLKINIESGVLVGGNLTAISNGYAKVYLNNVFDENGVKVDNISAYSLDGDVLDNDLVTLATGSTISSDITNWYHPQKANLSIDTNAIKVNTSIVLGSDIDSVNSLRYRWGGTSALRFIKNFGGRIKTTVQFPTGADKDIQAKTKIKTKLYIPEYTVKCYDYDTLKYTGKVNTEYSAGNSVSIGSSVDAAKLISYTNVWSGRQDMLYGAMTFGSRYDRYDYNGITDSYGDVSFKPAATSVLLGHDYPSGSFTPATVSGNVSHEAYIVVYSDEDVTLPIGTTIKVELELKLPTSMKLFNKFYSSDVNYDLDPVSEIEMVYLHYKGISDNTLKTSIVKNLASQTRGEKAYLSITDSGLTQVPDSYTWTLEPVSGYPIDLQYRWRTYLQYFKPEVLLQFAFSQVAMDIEIKLNGLKHENLAAKSFGGSQASVITNNNAQVSNNSTVYTNPIYIHSLDKHIRLQDESTFEMIDKIITSRYYNP